ncbi:hypothetical protein DQ04_04701060 [Trypanosoma grayi]|uniref:hypothetical protein n=1 Tax=Trypanosoma grayi TaxID=71804 RepID=UPI0004F41124|nr:hypothetical protein DQ04_04701060 [Trypanosoma grayi]KEG09761.1 hypothetical protein DQ04_04701060 [Trypanosoma grayi]
MLPLLRQRRGAALRGSGSLMLSAQQHSRRAASLTAAAVPDVVVCRRLRDCQQRAQILMRNGFDALSATSEQQRETIAVTSSSCCGARTLLELHEMAKRFVHLLHTTLFLPRDVVHRVEDFPMFLLHCFRRHDSAALVDVSMGEEAIVDGFIDWMDTALPTATLSNGEEVVSFVELMRLVQSFVRYHRGVRWGGGATKAEWYRGGYLLHPWHGTYCPSSRAEQMPYVHLLQWLLRMKMPRPEVTPGADDDDVATAAAAIGSADIGGGGGGGSSPRDDAMRAWRATEAFSPPAWRCDGLAKDAASFSALDCGCHSGYMTDLLLKAGAQQVVGVDVTSEALGSAEATLREHLRERRSTSLSRKTLQFVRCNLLPEWEAVTQREECPPTNGGVLAAAAAQRRRAGRRHQLAANPIESESSDKGVGPFDLLVFHPPLRPLFPSWPLLQDTSCCIDQFALDGGDNHPHSSLPMLRELLQRLLHSSSNGGNGFTERQQQRRMFPLLKDGGYIAFILPRSFDITSILKETSSLFTPFNKSGSSVSVMPLSDVVTSTLEGAYELVLRRRHSLAGLLDSNETTHRRNVAYMRAFAHPQFRKRIEQELDAFYRTYQTVDLLVFRKREHAGFTRNINSCDSEGTEGSNKSVVTPPSLDYEESFEYAEYIPAFGPSPSHHWTELTPSYSYLEDDFFGRNGAIAPTASHKRNFLAVGHTTPFSRQKSRQEEQEREYGEWGQANLHAVERNIVNYRSMFAAELKQKRGGRMRKMALQPLEKQEWYIDEKLVKSEAAKVDLLNELSRFDMQDWD